MPGQSIIFKIADSKGSRQQDKTLATMMENEKKGQV
jgi:hypothetical protein